MKYKNKINELIDLIIQDLQENPYEVENYEKFMRIKMKEFRIMASDIYQKRVDSKRNKIKKIREEKKLNNNIKSEKMIYDIKNRILNQPVFANDKYENI